MSGFVQISNRITRLVARAFVAGAAWLAAAHAAPAQTPQRVVSINLCTDQLAMMLADEGQLISVSRIAVDQNASSMAQAARAYPINHGQAEEVYLMRPDLVLAGVFTPKTTVSMLENLGIRVEIFPITKKLDEVRDQIAKMGRVLERPQAAAQMIADFDARRAALAAQGGARPRAMLYYANGYTSGQETLAHEILDLAGFRNAAVEAGYTWGMKMPLEVLMLSQPDLVITSPPYPGGSRAEDVMLHPAVTALQDHSAAAAVTSPDWICGTPMVLRAAETLAALRREMTEGRQ